MHAKNKKFVACKIKSAQKINPLKVSLSTSEKKSVLNHGKKTTKFEYGHENWNPIHGKISSM